MDQIITVVIADDHQGVRLGLKQLIERGGQFEVVGEAENGKKAIEVVNQKSPDLLILDVVMPVMRGDEVARQLIKQRPDLKILAVSSFDNPQYILTMLENGARGYLTKDEVPELLQKAAREIVLNQNTVWVSEKLKKQTGLEVSSEINTAPTLSATEYRILDLLKAGADNSKIAKELSFSTEQLERFYKILMMKFNVKSVQELIDTA
jgi:two-component system invasion response regulator UvrY